MISTPVACSLILIWPCLNQLPGRPAWTVMIPDSALIIVGTAESRSRVVHPDKMVVTSKPQPDGAFIAELPDPKDYIVGTIHHIRVDQVIKRHSRIKTDDVVDVFIPGVMTTDQPLLIDGKRYLLFLSPVQVGDGLDQRFAGTILQTPSDPSSKGRKFKPNRAYNIIWNGWVKISPANTNVIQEVEAALSQTQPIR